MMLGFHRRTRSLIPVKDLGKYDKVPAVEVEEEDEEQGLMKEYGTHSNSQDSTRSRSRQLTLIYIVFLAEAIMASSLQPQLQMLVSSSDYCGNLSSSYLRSILDCAYAFGGTTGFFWGYVSDRMGRRRVTLLGLWCMLLCCLGGGFATSLAGCAISRFVAGMFSSAVMCTSLIMIGDLSSTAKERVRNVTRLPLISMCGALGPLMQGMVAESLHAYGMVWEKFPTLGSELTRGSILLVIALTASIALKETLPRASSMSQSVEVADMDCEKATFLSRGSEDTNLTLVDTARPEPIKIAHFLQAPSFVILLSSFCLLSLHAATFDVLLPHLGHSGTEHGGMGIPCAWLSLVVLGLRFLAALAIFFLIPFAISKYGILTLYRSLSLAFPAAYVLTPLLALLASYATLVSTVSVLAILTKHFLANSAVTLVALLVLNTAPDAFSLGTVVGMMQLASLFRALAVAVSGTSFYFSTDVSVAVTNFALWTCLVLLGVAGAGVAWFVRERPSVLVDLPCEVLCWETCFDVDAEAGARGGCNGGDGGGEEDLESLVGEEG